MMLSKKNSEALENFSEKLEVEGRSLWQDARRRFMHNRAAVASLVVLVIIALFVTLAPMLSQFTYFDTDWGMMSSAPDMESGHYFGTDSSGRDLLVRVAIGGRISLMVGIAAALVAVIVGTLYGSLSGYLGGKVDSVMMRLLEILNSFPFMFFVILLVTFFGQNILLDLRGHRDGVLAGYGAYCSRPDAEPQTQRVYRSRAGRRCLYREYRGSPYRS
jgi:oligopeptide transport system permease protein